MKSKPVLGVILLILSLISAVHVQADSATWNLNPTSGDWNTANNWTPNVVPNGPSDVATFEVSNTTQVSLSSESTEVSEIDFNSSASSFNITAAPARTGPSVTLTISGVGVVNNSGVIQNFSIGPSTDNTHTFAGFLYFQNAASAGGSDTVYTAYGAANGGAQASGGVFYQNSTAGNATFVVEGATKGLDVDGGFFAFTDDATAGTASFTINGAHNGGGYGGSVGFGGNSTAGNAAFVVNPGTGGDLDAGEMFFSDNATAGNGVFTVNGAKDCCTLPLITFSDASTAGNGFFNNVGGRAPSGWGGRILFSGDTSTGLTTTAGNATIINDGGNGAGSGGSVTVIDSAATGAQARLVAYGGRNSGGAGYISIADNGDGGQAQVELHGAGYLDVSVHTAPGVTIGSLAGDGGFVYLGSLNLTVGSNNLDSVFTGIIQEHGGSVDGRNGSLTKIGTATLELSGANIYSGDTTVTAGNLILNNVTGSATGRGPVQVSGGTLGGQGRVFGAVTVGTGSQSGAILAPGAAVSNPATFTTLGAMTFKADGTYSWRLNTKTAKSDRVSANGVTIESGAQFDFVAVANRRLTPGINFTAISNTAVTPISGNFANLADGATITVGNNSYLASYEGGDGNDLTLTVLP